MYILDTTTRSLEFKLAGAITTNQLPCIATWADRTTTAFTPGATRALSNSTTAATIVASPAASTQRKVDSLTIKNNDTVSATVIVQYNDNTTIAELVKIALAVQDTLYYSDTDGWSVIDTTGQKKSIASIGSALLAGTANIGDVDVLTLPGVAGTVASDGVDSGNPVKIGLLAKTSDITPVTTGDRVDAIADTLGKQVVLLGAIHDKQVNGHVTLSNATASDVIAAAGAGVRIAVMSVVVVNGHASVGTKVEIRDDTTVKLQGYTNALGGGWNAQGSVPLFISTANKPITARCVTTGTDTDIFVSGYTIAN